MKLVAASEKFYFEPYHYHSVSLMKTSRQMWYRLMTTYAAGEKYQILLTPSEFTLFLHCFKNQIDTLSSHTGYRKMFINQIGNGLKRKWVITETVFKSAEESSSTLEFEVESMLFIRKFANDHPNFPS